MSKLVLNPVALRAFHDARQQASESSVRQAMPPEYRGNPIHLTASALGLQPGSQGASVNVKALVNPGPGPIEVFAIKFRLASNIPTTGAAIAAKLDLGNFPLTNGFIPIYAFGRADDLTVEQLRGGATQATTAFANGITRFYAEYFVKLSRPIFLPAGAAIRPQLAHKGQTNAAIDVHVALIGRALPANTVVPRTLWLPYWAAYTSKSFTLGTVDSDQSTENDLNNPFDVPMEMERFVGRIGYYIGSSAFSFQQVLTEQENSPLVSLQAVGFTTTLADALGQITCAIIDSNGYPVVKKLTPFRLVFDAETRSWPLSHSLAPGGYYLASLANSAWTVGDPTVGSGGSVVAQPCISMLGWREVA